MDRFERGARAVERLTRVMAKLRAPGGCPWDREQTLESLKTYLVEETYETLEAIDSGDPDKHREELGDLLLQIVFQSEITAGEEKFGLAEVADAITDKLIRRHPHVFGEAEAKDAAAVTRNWEMIKAAERPKSKGVLDGVPRAMPALLRALRTGEKAAAVGFDWSDVDGVRAKIEEELQELRVELDARAERAGAEGREPGSVERLTDEIGDLLFAVSNLARHVDVNPEEALRRTLDKFQRRFEHVERALAQENRRPADVGVDELERLWVEAKLFERR